MGNLEENSPKINTNPDLQKQKSELFCRNLVVVFAERIKICLQNNTLYIPDYAENRLSKFWDLCKKNYWDSGKKGKGTLDCLPLNEEEVNVVLKVFDSFYFLEKKTDFINPPLEENEINRIFQFFEPLPQIALWEEFGFNCIFELTNFQLHDLRTLQNLIENVKKFSQNEDDFRRTLHAMKRSTQIMSLFTLKDWVNGQILQPKKNIETDQVPAENFLDLEVFSVAFPLWQKFVNVALQNQAKLERIKRYSKNSIRKIIARELPAMQGVAQNKLNFLLAGLSPQAAENAPSDPHSDQIQNALEFLWKYQQHFGETETLERAKNNGLPEDLKGMFKFMHDVDKFTRKKIIIAFLEFGVEQADVYWPIFLAFLRENSLNLKDLMDHIRGLQMKFCLQMFGTKIPKSVREKYKLMWPKDFLQISGCKNSEYAENFKLLLLDLLELQNFSESDFETFFPNLPFFFKTWQKGFIDQKTFSHILKSSLDSEREPINAFEKFLRIAWTQSTADWMFVERALYWEATQEMDLTRQERESIFAHILDQSGAEQMAHQIYLDRCESPNQIS